MYKSEREKQILEFMKEVRGFVSVHTLCERLYASESSIRRDLVTLEKLGLIARTHGGATIRESNAVGIDISARARHNVEQKRVIAKKAASLVPDGAVVFLDQSSSAFYLAVELMHNKSLTVVTNNTEIASLLSRAEVKGVVSGGTLSSENRSCLIGSDAERMFGQIRADFVFFSTKALTNDGLLYDCTREEVCVRLSMLENARRRIFLCDSEKIGQSAAYRQCSLSDIDYLISENDTAQRFTSMFEKLRIL